MTYDLVDKVKSSWLPRIRRKTMDLSERRESKPYKTVVAARSNYGLRGADLKGKYNARRNDRQNE